MKDNTVYLLYNTNAADIKLRQRSVASVNRERGNLMWEYVDKEEFTILYSSEDSRKSTDIKIRSKTKLRKRPVSADISGKQLNVSVEGFLIRRANSLSTVEDLFLAKRSPLIKPLLSEAEITKLQKLYQECGKRHIEYTEKTKAGSEQKGPDRKFENRDQLGSSKELLKSGALVRSQELLKTGALESEQMKLKATDLVGQKLKARDFNKSPRDLSKGRNIKGISDTNKIQGDGRGKKRSLYGHKEEPGKTTKQTGKKNEKKFTKQDGKIKKAVELEKRKSTKRKTIEEKRSRAMNTNTKKAPMEKTIVENLLNKKKRSVSQTMSRVEKPIRTKSETSKTRNIDQDFDSENIATRYSYTPGKQKHTDQPSSDANKDLSSKKKTKHAKETESPKKERPSITQDKYDDSTKASTEVPSKSEQIKSGKSTKTSPKADENKRTRYTSLDRSDMKENEDSNKQAMGSKHLGDEISSSKKKSKHTGKDSAKSKDEKSDPGTSTKKGSVKNKLSQKKARSSNILQYMIQYVLSNPVFIKLGWTLQPIDRTLSRAVTFKAVPANPQVYCFRERKKEEIMFYPSGTIAVKIEEDGTGKIFYPNGSVAMTLNKSQRGMRLILYSDPKKGQLTKDIPLPRVIGIFDSFGNGVIYNIQGEKILNFNQLEGMFNNQMRKTVYKWRWSAYNELEKQRIKELLKSMVSEKKQQETTQVKKPTHGVKVSASFELKKSEEDKAYATMLAELPYPMVRKSKVKGENHAGGFTPIVLKINDEMILRISEQDNIFINFSSNKVIYRLNLGVVVDPEKVEMVDELVPDKLSSVPCIFDSLVRFSPSLLELNQQLQLPCGAKKLVVKNATKKKSVK